MKDLLGAYNVCCELMKDLLGTYNGWWELMKSLLGINYGLLGTDQGFVENL